MRILVTGGAGFIGSNLVHYLLDHAAVEFGVQIEKIVTLDKLTYAGNLTNLAGLETDSRHCFIQGDISDEALVSDLLREHRIHAVMHLAAESHVDRSIVRPEEFIMTNLVGTYRLLEAFRKNLPLENQRNVFLHVSTDEVFGSLSLDDPAFCETTRYLPSSPYSASKAGSDHLVRSYFQTYSLPAVITNCSNNYGPRQTFDKLIPLLIQKTLRGEPLPIYGNGQNIRDWLYVEDHCRGLTAAMLKGQLGSSYVIGGKCELTNLQVAHHVVETLRELCPERQIKFAEELIHFVTDRPGHDLRYAIDPAKMAREFAWEPRENFRSGLRKTVQWYLHHLGD